MPEKTIEIKICKHCNSNFEITDKDLEFYEKVSPIFLGKKYSIPTPKFCPDCRQQRRLTFRNEMKLYKRKCDATGKDIISIYSPDKKYKVYNSDYWWSDKWEPLDYGNAFDFDKGFFEQFEEILLKIPHLNLTAAFDSENSEYATFSGKMKDCYMVYACWAMENTLYSSRILSAIYVVDSLDGTDLEQCYETLNCEGCFGCFYIINSSNCVNSFFLYDCSNCSDCFLCYNLVGKKYHIENKEYSKEEYFIKLGEIKSENFGKGREALYENKKKAINRNLIMTNCENSIGDNLKNCKDCFNAFHFENSQNCNYVENGGMRCSNVYDGLGVGENLDLGYEILDTGINGIQVCFGITCYSCSYSFYNFNCHNSSFLFGCIGLRNKQYCILNKQYTKEEYEILVPKIIEHMVKKGEWGEFFPSNISPFGYNETVAMEYFPVTYNHENSPHHNPIPRGEGTVKGTIKNNKFIPLTLGEARGGQEVFTRSNYETAFPKVEKIIPGNKLPSNIKDIPDDILNWAIECKITKKPFRIVKAELEFYRKHNLPIPKKHPDQRHLERMALRNPRKLYDRKCDKCNIDIKTTYQQERPEIVYCEECYNGEIY